MIVFFYGFICTFFVILQTSILSYVSQIIFWYDIFIIFILYLIIFRPFIESLITIVIIGIIVDSLTSGFFGMYATVYFWLFFIMRWGIQFLHSDTYIVLSLLSGFSVLLENLFLIIEQVLLGQPLQFSRYIFNIIVFQILLALLTGPFIILCIKYLHKKFDQLVNKISSKK